MEIPKTLLAFYLNDCGFDKYVYYQKNNSYRDGVVYSNSGSKPLFKFNPISKKHRNKTSKLSSIWYYHYSVLEESKGELSLRSLENSGFIVSLNLKKTEHRSGVSFVALELDHPTFKDLSVQPYISIPFREFIKLLQGCNGQLDEGGKLSGTYKISIETTGANPIYKLIREDILTPLTDLYTKFGQAAESIVRTRKWELGHIYANKDLIFLYLGEVDNMDIVNLNSYYGNLFIRPYLPFYSFLGTKNYLDWKIVHKTEDTYINRKNVRIGINLSNVYLEKVIDVIYHLKTKSDKISIHDLILEIYTKTDELFINSSGNKTIIAIDPTRQLGEPNPLAYDLGKYVELEHSDPKTLKYEIDTAILKSLDILDKNTYYERLNEKVLYYLIDNFPDQIDKEKYKESVYNNISKRFNSFSKFLYNLVSAKGIDPNISLGKQLGDIYREQYDYYESSSNHFGFWSNEYKLLNFMKDYDIPFIGKFNDDGIDKLLEYSYTHSV